MPSTIYNCLEAEGRGAGLSAAAEALRAGQCVVLPTDTVYGIGADAFNNDAVARLLATKRRGPDMPVPVLVGSWMTIQGLVREFSETAKTLVEAFWPGGLSIVVPEAPSLPWNLGDTRGTVLLRMPNQPLALELLREVGPMAVSSALGQPAGRHRRRREGPVRGCHLRLPRRGRSRGGGAVDHHRHFRPRPAHPARGGDFRRAHR